MIRRHSVQCDGPICRPFLILKDADKPTSHTVNIITKGDGETFAKYGWSVYVPPEGRNYYFCPRCTKEIELRMNLTN